MTYVIEPSAFGFGYSIFKIRDVDGNRIKHYLTDALNLVEARALCPDAVSIVCYAELGERIPRPMQVRCNGKAA